MPRKPRRKRAVRRTRRRRIGGSAILPRSLGESNINAIHRIEVGENNLAAIEHLKQPKPPLQPTGQIVNLPNVAYPISGTVPFFDRVRGILKRSKVISRTARKLGAHRIASYAEMRGYGRRKRHRGGAALIDRYGSYIHNF